MNKNLSRRYAIYSLAMGFTLGSTFAFGQSSSANFSRKTIHLNAPAMIGGVPVKAGDVDVFEPGEQLAHGTLSQAFPFQKLSFPVDSELMMESPGQLASVRLPSQELFWLAGAPFRAGSELSFGYNQYFVRFHGTLAYNPAQYPDFPQAGLNSKAFENNVSASCRQSKFHWNEPGYNNWFCMYSLVLTYPLEQQFSTQTVTLPQGTLIDFEKWGISSLKLAQDDELMGLPISAAKAMRVNRWSQGGPQGIVEASLSRDAVFKGISLSAIEPLEFYEADSAGNPVLSSFAPLGDLPLSGDGQKIVVAALKGVHVNRDRSLRYGNLAFAQTIQGILFPEDSLVFLGDRDGTPIESVGLPPSTTVIIDGVTYGPSSDQPRLFLDFDEKGKVVRVRH